MPDKHRILATKGLLPLLERQLREEFELEVLPAEPGAREEMLAGGARFDGLVTSASLGLDAALLERLPALRVISSFGVGLDKLPLQAAAARGIPVGYTPDLLNDCVADLAFALMLAAARRVAHGDRFVRAGRWTGVAGTPPPSLFPLGRRVSGARLGVVGLGRIGRAIARRAAGFDMEVAYFNRRPVAGVAWRHEPDLQALARWCDFLVVSVAGGAETRGLVSAQVLDALGTQGYLVNVSRGSVVDEPALVRALAGQRIAGAGLDVFAQEPQVPPALLALDNVVLLPHLGSATEQTRQAMALRVVENLRGFFRDGTLVSQAPA